METSELRRLAKICLQKEINLNWDNYDKKIKVADIYGHIIDAMLSFHEQASRDTKERLKIQIDLNDKLLLELKESTQRIIELEGELSELINP